MSLGDKKSYRNDGPPLFLKTSMMHNTDKLDLKEVKHKIPEGDAKRWGKCDLYVWVDHGEDALGCEPWTPPSPSAYWCSDSHLGKEYRVNKAKEFDYVFVTIPEHIQEFKEAVGHDKVYWLPHAGEPTCYKKEEVIKKYDVCFIGHIPNDERAGLLDRLFKEFPDFYFGQKFFEEASEKYCQSKIVLNHCISREANMRVFEATLSGSLCLCTESDAIKALGYQDGVNIAFYKDEDEMVAKAQYYLDHEEEREQVAKAGMEHTLKHHTYLHRSEQMLSTIREDQNGSKQQVN